MIKIVTSIAGLGVAFLLTACGSGTSAGPSPQGGSGAGRSGSAGGTASGGAGGKASGGSVSGGATGNASGGRTGIQNGGSDGGTGGKIGGTGGLMGTGGGNPTGGVQGTGGSPETGGSTGTGGSMGTGGSTIPSSILVTSASGAYWQSGTITTVTSNPDITVTDTTAYQTWDGFGGTFNEAGWDALSVLPATERDRAMKLLFDTNEGANFAYGRVPIGASDYSMDRYTLNENVGDFTMDKFSIERDKQRLIPFIKAALAIKSNLHLWASPWTPPTWMKTGPYTTDGITGWDGGNMKDDAQVLKAHAIYLAKFVEAYGKENIKIEAIHPQNEPGYATRYPSCLWTATLMTKFIGTYLGPTFAERNITAQIYLGTMSNNDSGKDNTIIHDVNSDATASQYIKGFGLQWNMLPAVAGLTSKGQVVQTEHKCGNYPWNPGGGLPAFNPNKPQNDYAYGVESWTYIRDWIKAGVHVYSAWNMVLDTAGKNLDATRPWPQNALMTVDRTAKTLTLTPAFYVFRHVSQFVVPGAKRVATTGSSPDTLAFKNPDGTIVAIMYNSGNSAKTTTVALAGTKLQFSIPANGFATLRK